MSAPGGSQPSQDHAAAEPPRPRRGKAAKAAAAQCGTQLDQENASPASPLGGAAADFGSSPRSQLGGDVGGGAAANEPASGFGRSPRGQLAGGAASGLTGGASDHQGGLLGGLLAGFPLPGPRPLGFEPYEDEELHGETAGPEPGRVCYMDLHPNGQAMARLNQISGFLQVMARNTSVLAAAANPHGNGGIDLLLRNGGSELFCGRKQCFTALRKGLAKYGAWLEDKLDTILLDLLPRDAPTTAQDACKKYEDWDAAISLLRKRARGLRNKLSDNVKVAMKRYFPKAKYPAGPFDARGNLIPATAKAWASGEVFLFSDNDPGLPFGRTAAREVLADAVLGIEDPGKSAITNMRVSAPLAKFAAIVMGCYLRDEAVELDAAAQAQYVADFEALAATTNKFITWDNTVAPVA